jgi:hypothetical protein
MKRSHDRDSRLLRYGFTTPETIHPEDVSCSARLIYLLFEFQQATKRTPQIKAM